jgi:hypothetical protein
MFSLDFELLSGRIINKIVQWNSLAWYHFVPSSVIICLIFIQFWDLQFKLHWHPMHWQVLGSVRRKKQKDLLKYFFFCWVLEQSQKFTRCCPPSVLAGLWNL